MINIDENVSNNLKKIRWKLGLTLEDMGSITGLSNGAISKIENGKSIPSQDTIKAICKAINLPANKVFDLDNEWVKL